MIIRDFPLELTLDYPLEQIQDLDKILFFDIETTGFAADTTFLYLIGCIYHKAGSFHMLQWFAEDYREEDQLLISFFKFLKDYKLLVHFNGTGFDIPYLMKKCDFHQLPYTFEAVDSLDLYKKTLPIKRLLNLASYRQKSIESFLKINREDVASGGELIEVYQHYLGKKRIESFKESRGILSSKEENTEAEELLHLLLLHNEDDIKGLIQICPILYYSDLLDKPFHLLQAAVEEKQLVLRFEFSFCLPISVSCVYDNIRLTVEDNHALLTIQTIEDELKHFYDNPKDYYYLPAEDSAIHNSLAQFVDKKYRQKAKPSNCYIRKTGLFVPQFAPMITPYFKYKHQDKVTFLEIHTDFLLQEANLEIYIRHLLEYVLTSKKVSVS